VYQWHLWAGLFLVLGAGFVLYFALLDYNLKTVTQLFHARASVWLDLVLQIAWWLVTLGALAGLVVGVLLMVRPGLLQSADAWANRNYSGRRATKGLEDMNFAPDRWIASSPKLSGGIIVAGSLYVALVLGALLAAKTQF
jgi:hypothetical protein